MTSMPWKEGRFRFRDARGASAFGAEGLGFGIQGLAPNRGFRELDRFMKRYDIRLFNPKP